MLISKENEEWRIIPGYRDYNISNYGRVYRPKNSFLWAAISIIMFHLLVMEYIGVIMYKH